MITVVIFAVVHVTVTPIAVMSLCRDDIVTAAPILVPGHTPAGEDKKLTHAGNHSICGRRTTMFKK